MLKVNDATIAHLESRYPGISEQTDPPQVTTSATHANGSSRKAAALMALIWRQWCHYRAKEQDRLGGAALEAGDVVAALLHLRAAVRLDCNIQLRLERAEIYERGARLWRESAEVRDEIRRREGLAWKPGQWLYELRSSRVIG